MPIIVKNISMPYIDITTSMGVLYIASMIYEPLRIPPKKIDMIIIANGFNDDIMVTAIPTYPKLVSIKI